MLTKVEDGYFRLREHRNFKLGFTTANFAKALPASAANIGKLIGFARDRGFSFIELRDGNVDLALEECRDLAAMARENGVEVIYALNSGALDPDYFEKLDRGLVNAASFFGPRFIRTGANGNELKADPDKGYWSADEFSALVRNLDRAGHLARSLGLMLSVENAREGVRGDGSATFGTRELFSAGGTGATVFWQLDVANFFCTSKVRNDPDSVRTVFETLADRISYTHLKTSDNGQSRSVLEGNELGLDIFLKVLAAKGKDYIALELAPADSLVACENNHDASLSYLVSRF